MAGPQLITGLEPTDSASLFAQGWQFVADQVFNKGAQGTPIHFVGPVYANGAQVLGFNLWGQITSAQIAAQLGKTVKVYYVSIWHNPPTAIAIAGEDSYAAVAVTA